MRNIRILNNKYEDVSLFSPIAALNGYTLNDVFKLEVPVPFLSLKQYDYWEEIYDYIKSGIKVDKLNYKPFGRSIQDIAWRNKWTGKNLASPDLSNATYLGDGWYELHQQNGGTLTYNVYSGEYRLFGNMSGNFIYNFGYNRPYADDCYIQIWKTKQVIWDAASDSRVIGFGGGSAYQITIHKTKDYEGKKPLSTTMNQIYTYNLLGNVDVYFRLQLEQGSTATDYEIPYIDGYSKEEFRYSDLFESVDEQFTIPDIENLDLSALQPKPSIEQMNRMFSFYMANRFNRVLPNVYLPIEPTGFGNRYKFKELNNKVYDHELDFENMAFDMLFGIHSNAYVSYKVMQDFVKDNELVLEYDYGIGKRYTDVRLINAPKTEKDTTKLIRSRFEFKRLTPFYELLGVDDLPITNTSNLDMGIVYEADYSEPNKWFRVIIDGLTYNFNLSNTQGYNYFAYDSMNKKILLDGENIGYGFIDWNNTDEVFIVLKPNQTLEEIDLGNYDTIESMVFRVKKWVED